MNYASRKLNICLPPHFRFNFSAGVAWYRCFCTKSFLEQTKATKWDCNYTNKNIADCCIPAELLHRLSTNCKVRFSNEHVKVLYNITEFVSCLYGMANDMTGSRKGKMREKEREQKETRQAERFVCVTSRRLCVIYVLHLVRLRVLPRTECGKTELENAFHACHVA